MPETINQALGCIMFYPHFFIIPSLNSLLVGGFNHLEISQWEGLSHTVPYIMEK